MAEKVDFSILSEVLPPIVWRARWDVIAEKCGLPFRRSYLQNLDSEKKGPPKITFGNRVGYERGPLINWLNTRRIGGRARHAGSK